MLQTYDSDFNVERIYDEFLYQYYADVHFMTITLTCSGIQSPARGITELEKA
jgi:hypothetical protein